MCTFYFFAVQDILVIIELTIYVNCQKTINVRAKFAIRELYYVLIVCRMMSKTETPSKWMQSYRSSDSIFCVLLVLAEYFRRCSTTNCPVGGECKSFQFK